MKTTPLVAHDEAVGVAERNVNEIDAELSEEPRQPPEKARGGIGRIGMTRMMNS